MEKDAFEKIANMVLEVVGEKWSPNQQEKWKLEFLLECSTLQLPTYIQITHERVHSSIMIACQSSGTHYKDILYMPLFQPVVFYVHNLYHFKYCPIGISPVDYFV